MKQSKKIIFTTNILIGILFLIFSISLGLFIAINCRFLYYADIKNIAKETGYSTGDIQTNYDALIDYCNPFFNKPLKFPTFPASETGLSHFAEVKAIFNIFFGIMLVSPILLVALIYMQHKRKAYSYLFTAPMTMLAAPIIVFIICAIDFDNAFLMFHKIIFRNEDWYFDTVTDPIINILPARYFLMCALVIILTVLIICVILLILYIHKKKKRTRIR